MKAFLYILLGLVVVAGLVALTDRFAGRAVMMKMPWGLVFGFYCGAIIVRFMLLKK